ncbi:MAG: RDD family protein [Isosphaeraceae bacterium]
MSTKIAFETPENIQVAYQPAGLGTRFVAWFVDTIIMAAAGVVIFFILMCSGVITDSVIRDIVEPGRQTARRPAGQPPGETSGAVWYAVGLFLLVSGVGSFIYFGASELFSRGQTLGKRLSGIRVVRADGFALEPGGILVRNIFRVIDQQPPLWLVPLISKRSQRLGDMVAGTVVVFDKPESIGNLRLSLAQRPAGVAQFAFDATTLKRARPQDFDAVERILERWDGLTGDQQQQFLGQIVPPLAARLKTDLPPTDQRLQFLHDLLAAEYKRQHRSLG